MDAQSMEAEFELDAFAEFLTKYPAYKDTMIIDSLRWEEYPHLDEKGQTCLDYTGVGLFSGSQIGQTGIEYSHTPSNLATHAMYPEDGSTEIYFRKRVLQYLNLDEEDYYIVFTANAFSAFKLLGTSYPFHESSNLLLAYDHKCENVDALIECCCSKSACVHSVALSWPCCRIDPFDLKKKLQCKRKVLTKKRGAHKGLFAFPYSSRVTGYRSSSWWIPQAQQNGWHVLLDITSTDAKILDSLGLSLFLPEYVICSFYNVFGEDPTGLGCLAIKKSAIRTLGDSSRAQAIGMVTIINKQLPILISSNAPTCVDDGYVENGVARPQGATGLAIFEQASPHRPDWSVDLVSIDETLFFRSNNDYNTGFNGVRQNVFGKGDVPYQISNDEDDNRKEERDKNLLTDGVVNLGENAQPFVTHIYRGEASSCSMRMANEAVHAVSLQSVSIRERTKDDLQSASTSYDRASNGFIEQNGTSEIEELEPRAPDNDSMKITGQSKTSQRRNLKGLSCSDAANLPSTSHTSLCRLFKYETKAKIREHLQRAGQVYHGQVLTVHDWMSYYAERSRVLNSNSSSASSSYRFAIEDADCQEAHRQAKIASLQTEIVCKGLDHADVLGYKRVAVRLRSLAEWLICALLRLQHPPPNCFKLVKFCSQKTFRECVSAFAFNLADTSGKAFDVSRVQLLADRNNISIRTGIVAGTCMLGSQGEDPNSADSVGCMELSSYKCLPRDGTMRRLEMSVLYVSLGFLNNFSDVYRLFRFICRFLDPQFVKQELWQYQALNQETIEL